MVDSAEAQGKYSKLPAHIQLLFDVETKAETTHKMSHFRFDRAGLLD